MQVTGLLFDGNSIRIGSLVARRDGRDLVISRGGVEAFRFPGAAMEQRFIADFSRLGVPEFVPCPLREEPAAADAQAGRPSRERPAPEARRAATDAALQSAIALHAESLETEEAILKTTGSGTMVCPTCGGELRYRRTERGVVRARCASGVVLVVFPPATSEVPVHA